jgi:hypothetical protein
MPAKNEVELRDWFAGQALAGILMSPNTPRPGESALSVHATGLAEQAYAYADAMLRERDKRRPRTTDVAASPSPT